MNSCQVSDPEAYFGKKEIDRRQGIVLFCDLRGFSAWMDACTATTEEIGNFIMDFFSIVADCMTYDFFKLVGDGVLIARYYDSAGARLENFMKSIDNILEEIQDVEREVEALDGEFTVEKGFKTSLKMGWAVSRGEIVSVNGDIIGRCINRCKKLVDLAKPFGIIINRDCFPYIHQTKSCYTFFKDYWRFYDNDTSVKIWATPEIKEKIDRMRKDCRDGN